MVGHTRDGSNKAPDPIVIASSSLSTSSLYLSATLSDVSILCLVDTGAAVTLMSEDAWKKTFPQGKLDTWMGPALVSAAGTPLQVLGTTTVSLCFCPSYSADVSVVIVTGLSVDMFLGLDFLSDHECSLDLGRKLVHFPLVGHSFALVPTPLQDSYVGSSFPVFVGATTCVPAFSELEVLASVPSHLNGGFWLFKGHTSKGVVAARALVSPRHGQIVIRFCNPGNQPVHISSTTKVGVVEALPESISQAGVTVSKGTCCSQEKHDIIRDVITSSCSDLSGPRKDQPVNSITLAGQNLDDVVKCQGEDTDIGPVLRAKQAKVKPTDAVIRQTSRECQQLFAQWDQLVVDQSLLWRMFHDSSTDMTHHQLVLPRSLRDKVLEDVHQGAMGGHLGYEKTLAKVKERFYWPGHSTDVKTWCQCCPACTTRKTPAPRNRAPLQSVKVGYPMQMVAVDILGPLLESDTGNSYILVATDYFTRWVEAYPIPNQEAVTVAKKLTDELFFRFGPPDQLHSDQGRQFESELLAEVCRLLGIHKTRTTPYHPQGDGLMERFNRTLLDMLANTAKDHPFQWEQHIRSVCMAYNSSVQTTTGYSPFYLMFGRKPRLPVDLSLGTSQPKPSCHAEYAQEMQKSFSEAHSMVRDKMSAQLDQQKDVYDKRCHGQPYDIGDLVWLHSTVVPKGRQKKLHHPWIGPFQVIKKISDVTYRIQDPNRRSRRHVVHFNRLKKCTSPPKSPQSTPDVSPEQVMDKETPPISFGTNLEVVDSDDAPPRYPARAHHPPNRYGVLISH